jgi:hypothetical protein
MKSISSLIKTIESSKEVRKEVGKCVAALHKVARREKEEGSSSERVKSLKIKEYKVK